MPKSATHEQHAIYNNLHTGPRKFTTITNYTNAELDATIAVLAEKHGEILYEYLNFIDAYFERRTRKLNKETF